MQLNNVTSEDNGTWTCELEEYKLGDIFGRGKKDTQTMLVIVNRKNTNSPDDFEQSGNGGGEDTTPISDSTYTPLIFPRNQDENKKQVKLPKTRIAPLGNDTKTIMTYNETTSEFKKGKNRNGNIYFTKYKYLISYTY